MRLSLPSLLGTVLLLAVACRTETTETTTSGTAGTGGAAQTGEPLSVLNWNVHNLVNDQLDGDNTPFEDTDSNWDAHRKAVAKVLDSLDADIVMLQEVEHLEVLQELNGELGNRYEVSLTDANDPRGIDNAVMSKLPIIKVVSHKDDFFTKEGTSSPTYKYARDCVEVHVELNGRALVFLNVHYKAKENDDPDKRLAEAQHTRGIANEIIASNPDTGIIILGDFNDLPGSSAYTHTIGEEPDVYQNAADQVDAEDRWTFKYKGQLELVDQQMFNPVLGTLLVTSSVQIPHTRDVENASDHSPVFATYSIQ